MMKAFASSFEADHRHILTINGQLKGEKQESYKPSGQSVSDAMKDIERENVFLSHLQLQLVRSIFV